MTQTLTLPSLTTIPDNMEEQVRRLLPAPREPGLEAWLFELIKASGHLSTPDNLRWRVISIIWLAAEFDVDKAWPYLMWLNTGQPVISEHLAEILSEAANDLDCHVELANWIAQAQDERLITFFTDFHHIPARYNMPGLVRRLLTRPTAPEVGAWLAAYCRDTAANSSVHLRPWRLLTATWYATCFDPQGGLAHLKELSQGESMLSAADNKILTDTAAELNCLTSIIHWIANCSDSAVRTMLKDFGHPNLAAFTAAIFQQPPNYQPLADPAQQAETDAHIFKRTVTLLEQAGLSKTARLLDLACGPLAAQALLFNSAGYQPIGVDLHIPPAYLPATGLVQRLFQREKYVKAWKTATAPYYQALTQHSGLKLKWRGLKVELADVTRLRFPDSSFDAVICLNHLHHAPNVESLLAEAARVLKPGGVLAAVIMLHPASVVQPTSSLIFNQWHQDQYRAAFETFFRLEQWQVEPDSQPQTPLSPLLRAELADDNKVELTGKKIMAVARKI